MTSDLVTWLREQLDADDQDTRRELASFDADDRHIVDLLDPNERRTVELLRGRLREVDAKRRILDEMKGDEDFTWLCKVLALPYTDRPGYRDEWRP